MSQAGIVTVSDAILPPDVPTTFTGNVGSGSPVANIFNIVGTGIVSTSVSGNTLTISSSGGGSVTSVSGTLNRITSTGGTTPVIDIAATYVGQTSITTLGTIGTGVWNGTAIDLATYVSGNLSVTHLNSGTSASATTFWRGDGTWATPAGTGVTSVSGTLDRITSTGGTTPVIDIAATYVGQNSITTLGTVSTGTWQATAVDATHGGTNQTTYAAGDILYASAINTLSKLPISTDGKVLTLASGLPSWQTATGGVTSVTGTANQILASPTTGAVVLSLIGPYTPATYTAHGVLIGEGTSSIVATSAGTSGQLLQSKGASADPDWTTATYPSTAGTSGNVLTSNGTNWVSSTPAASVTLGDIITQVYQGMGA